MAYISGDLTKPDLYEKLRAALDEAEKAHGTRGNAIFYLAVADRLFGTVVEQLGKAKLTDQGEDQNGGRRFWRRVVIEKPFGHSLDSARALNSQILRTLHEDQIFRIDHFLGKDTVQNIMAFRFANGIFEPMWNCDRIDHVQITAAETVGVEGRGSFYETTGALRDMVPNHLFTLLSMVTMEPPVGFDAGAIRSKKAELLAAIPEVKPSEAVRGQYGAGTVLGKRTNAYRQEPNVAPNSNVETYVALRLRSTIGAGRVRRSICGPANICRSGTLRSPSASSRPPTRPSKIRLWTLYVRIGWCCASLRTKEFPCNSRSSAAAP